MQLKKTMPKKQKKQNKYTISGPYQAIKKQNKYTISGSYQAIATSGERPAHYERDLSRMLALISSSVEPSEPLISIKVQTLGKKKATIHTACNIEAATQLAKERLPLLRLTKPDQFYKQEMLGGIGILGYLNCIMPHYDLTKNLEHNNQSIKQLSYEIKQIKQGPSSHWLVKRDASCQWQHETTKQILQANCVITYKLHYQPLTRTYTLINESYQIQLRSKDQELRNIARSICNLYKECITLTCHLNFAAISGKVANKLAEGPQVSTETEQRTAKKRKAEQIASQQKTQANNPFSPEIKRYTKQRTGLFHNRKQSRKQKQIAQCYLEGDRTYEDRRKLCSKLREIQQEHGNNRGRLQTILSKHGLLRRPVTNKPVEQQTTTNNASWVIPPYLYYTYLPRC